MKFVGGILIISGIVILLFTFGPVAKEEVGYQFNQLSGGGYSSEQSITPVDTGFGIVITKININAKIFPEIDSQNPQEFLPILKKGVAHAKGSAYPDQDGNVFLFAHSTDAFYNVAHYNAVFFLIGKLEKGDEIDIFYKDKRYKYEVIEKAVVSPDMLGQYVKEHTGGKTLTLQTCYPPGTTLKRLLVIVKQVEK